MDENQTSISKHTNNTPFVAFKTKNERNNQREKQASHPKTRAEEQ
jgi:hypothetical protein